MVHTIGIVLAVRSVSSPVQMLSRSLRVSALGSISRVCRLRSVESCLSHWTSAGGVTDDMCGGGDDVLVAVCTALQTSIYADPSGAPTSTASQTAASNASAAAAAKRAPPKSLATTTTTTAAPIARTTLGMTTALRPLPMHLSVSIAADSYFRFVVCCQVISLTAVRVLALRAEQLEMQV